MKLKVFAADYRKYLAYPGLEPSLKAEEEEPGNITPLGFEKGDAKIDSQTHIEDLLCLEPGQ